VSEPASSACPQTDADQSAAAASAASPAAAADQPITCQWSASGCGSSWRRYAAAAAAATYMYDHPPCYESSGTTAARSQYVDYLPCNMQQRLAAGGALVQYHSPGGAAVFNDAIQQRALSDLSGRYIMSLAVT